MGPSQGCRGRARNGNVGRPGVKFRKRNMEISGRSCAVTAKNCTVLKSVMLVQNYCFACVFVQGDKGVFRDV